MAGTATDSQCPQSIVLEAETEVNDWEAAMDNEIRGLIFVREALDEWARRFAEAKHEVELRFDAEITALRLKREALDARTNQLFEMQAQARDSARTKSLEALKDGIVSTSHAEDQHYDTHLHNEMEEQKLQEEKVASCSELVIGNKKRKKETSLNGKAAKNKNGQWWCAVCKIDCESSKNLTSHYSGKKHTNMLKLLSEECESTDKMNGQMQKKGQGNTVFSTLKIPQYWCDVCKLDCESSRSLATHFNGKKHRNALKQAEEFGSTDQQNDLEMDSLNPVPIAKQEPIEGQMLSSETSCAICHIVCPNAQSLASHLVGKKHQKKISMETKDAGSPRSEPRNYVSASEQ